MKVTVTKIHHTCDRCGREEVTPKGKSPNGWRVVGGQEGGWRVDGGLDLCGGCAASFERWFAKYAKGKRPVGGPESSDEVSCPCCNEAVSKVEGHLCPKSHVFYKCI